MSQLAKAILQELPNGPDDQPGPEVEVQFNPASLNLTFHNAMEGGQSSGRETRDYIGASSTVLALDLVFDTSEEGTTDDPISVRTRTAVVESLMKPRATGDEDQAQVVPRVSFKWGSFKLEGVVEGLTIDLTHFAGNGTPLRAKAHLSMKGQDPKLALLASGRGAKRDGRAPDPVSGGLGFGAGVGLGLGVSAGVGLGVGVSAGFGFGAGVSLGASAGVSLGLGARAAVALGGESLAEFATRQGLDPTRWRGLAAGVADPLHLEAGAEISFSRALDLSLGVGATTGAASGIDASLEARLGLEGAGGTGAARARAGFALSAAGGVVAALESVSQHETRRAENAALVAFGGAPRPFLPTPRADRRAESYGAGVPLRPLRRVEEHAASVVTDGTKPPSRRDATSLWSTDPARPPWERLPRRDAARQRADSSQRARDPRRFCGRPGCCGGRSGCRCT